MNQENRIKKSEKKILIYLLNILSIFKKTLISFFRFFLNIGNQKVTVMFIPHSEKKVFNFRVNIFILFTISFLCFATIGFILHLTMSNYNKSKLYKDATTSVKINEKRSREYEEMINEIIANHKIFKTKLDILLSRLDSTSIKTMQENNLYNINQGGPINKIDTAEISEFDIEKLEVNKLINEYQYSIQAFGEINKMVGNYSKLLKDLPFGSPVKGPYHITSSFGFRIHPLHKVLDMHQGIDLAAQLGTFIVATAPGIVEKVEWNVFGYGWYCKISHKLGYSTLYAHLRSQPIVKPGDRVRKGQIIGYMGRTGATTGIHLHYEVRLGDNLMDPWKFVSIY